MKQVKIINPDTGAPLEVGDIVTLLSTEPDEYNLYPCMDILGHEYLLDKDDFTEDFRTEKEKLMYAAIGVILDELTKPSVDTEIFADNCIRRIQNLNI